MSEPWTLRDMILVVLSLAQLLIPVVGIVYLRFFRPRPKRRNVTEAEVFAEIDRRLAIGAPRPGRTRFWWRRR